VALCLVAIPRAIAPYLWISVRLSFNSGG
jgi:hypothetical protein